MCVIQCQAVIWLSQSWKEFNIWCCFCFKDVRCLMEGDFPVWLLVSVHVSSHCLFMVISSVIWALRFEVFAFPDLPCHLQRILYPDLRSSASLHHLSLLALSNMLNKWIKVMFWSLQKEVLTLVDGSTTVGAKSWTTTLLEPVRVQFSVIKGASFVYVNQQKWVSDIVRHNTKGLHQSYQLSTFKVFHFF